MHRSHAPSIAPGTFFVAQSWADFTTDTTGFNLRQAHRTVTLKVKFADFELISRSRTLAGVVGSRNEFEVVSAELLKALLPMQKAVRLLGVSISGFKLDEIRRAEQIALGL
jgi:nucleotidyltransferase/DNA polymerase involved in DNA repair